jgi:hypothetical protein
MRKHLGEVYADTYAREQVLGEIGSRTVHEALADGESTQRVWRAVWAALKLPESER